MVKRKSNILRLAAAWGEGRRTTTVTFFRITITNWDDDLIGNAATLAGALIPWLANFDKLIENIRLEQSKTEMVIEKLTNERVDQVDNFTKELKEELNRLRKLYKVTVDDRPLTKAAKTPRKPKKKS